MFIVRQKIIRSTYIFKNDPKCVCTNTRNLNYKIKYITKNFILKWLNICFISGNIALSIIFIRY